MAAIADLPIYCEEWEPFWRLAEETGIPVGFHLAVRINPPPARVPQSVASAVQSMLGPQQLKLPLPAYPHPCAGSLPESQARDGRIRHRRGAIHDPAPGRELSQNARRPFGRHPDDRL